MCVIKKSTVAITAESFSSTTTVVSTTNTAESSTSHVVDDSMRLTSRSSSSSSTSSILRSSSSSSPSPRGQTKNNNTRSVSFSPVVKARFTISRRHFTISEMDQYWYTSQQFKDMLRQCCMEVKQIQQHQEERGNNDTNSFKDLMILLHSSNNIRGLESYTKSANQLKAKRRMAAYRAVLLKEEEDHDPLAAPEDDDDDEYYHNNIAEKYRRVSASCQSYANTIGLLDQKVANQIYNK